MGVRLRFLPAFALALGLVSGCDGGYPYEEGPIEVTGRVVLSPGGEPLAGFGVALMRNVSRLGAAPVATVRTDAGGQFALRYVVEGREHASYYVMANGPYEAYDSRYTTNGVYLPAPPVQRDLGTIEVRLNDTP
jgi:hypothetical protein